jgi:oligopeptide transport system substrate-binding protein
VVVFALACVGVGLVALNAWRDGSPSLATAAPDGFASPLATPVTSEAEGGTLRLAGSLPPTLDPATVQDSTSSLYVVHLFSGLVALDADLEVAPDIAQSWEISADGTTYTFHLDPAATFQNGRAITAEDFVYSLERALAPETGSPVAASYLGDIVGAQAYAAGEREHLEGIRTVDAHPLELRIDAPKAYFLANLTYPTALLVDREQIEREGDEWVLQPNGSGPFALESLSMDEIVLVRNERYYGRRPSVARVEFVLSGGVPMSMYENGLLDIVEVGAADIERVLDPANSLSTEAQNLP